MHVMNFILYTDTCIFYAHIILYILIVRSRYSLWSGTQKEWADKGFDMDFVSDPKSWRGESPLVYKNPGPYKQPNVGSDGFGGSSEGRQR